MSTLGLGLGVQIIVPRWDPDALAYIAQVEIADGQTARAEFKKAANEFFRSCKAAPSPVVGVSNWDAITHFGFLAGPETLDGALVPLKGAALTATNFVSGDYNPVLGLKGSGGKFLRANSVPQIQGNIHVATNVSEGLQGSIGEGFIGYNVGQQVVLYRDNATGTPIPHLACRGQNFTIQRLYLGDSADEFTTGFYGFMRDPGTAGELYYRTPKTAGSVSLAANSSTDVIFNVFVVNTFFPTVSRLTFYSVGQAVDLAHLDNATKTYLEAIA